MIKINDIMYIAKQSKPGAKDFYRTSFNSF
jgi:hypothetical protein